MLQYYGYLSHPERTGETQISAELAKFRSILSVENLAGALQPESTFARQFGRRQRWLDYCPTLAVRIAR